tara:strand:- start:506 stop:1363 length:858 start_codon:yes stop_codon:yes gene_type:complete
MNKDSAIIVTYKPNINKLKKLVESILIQKFNVIIVDNSESNSKIFIDNCSIIHLNKNMGIAYAQNKGIDLARKLNSESVVFFDQDSIIDKNFFKNIKEKISKNELAVFIPLIIDYASKKPLPIIKIGKYGFRKKVFLNTESEIQLVDLIISSGSYMNIKTLQSIGPMDEELFIDFVDTDFSFKCRYKNIPIYILPKATIYHTIGSKNLNFFNYTIFIHDKSRCYYQFRNCLFLFKRSYIPKLFISIEFFSLLFHHFISFFYVKEKIKYLKYLFLGIVDGLRLLIR